jgi:uncharacterized protein (UPF0210 family)
MKNVSSFSCTPYPSLDVYNVVEIIIFTFKRSIRVRVVTLHTQQLHGFDEVLNVQRIIRNCSEKIDTTTLSLYVSGSYFNL